MWLVALHFSVRRYLARLAEVAKSTQEGLGEPPRTTTPLIDLLTLFATFDRQRQQAI